MRCSNRKVYCIPFTIKKECGFPGVMRLGRRQAVRVGVFSGYLVCLFHVSNFFQFHNCQTKLIQFDDRQTNLIQFDDRQTNLIWFVDANPILFCFPTGNLILFWFAGHQSTIAMNKTIMMAKICLLKNKAL